MVAQAERGKLEHLCVGGRVTEYSICNSSVKGQRGQRWSALSAISLLRTYIVDCDQGLASHPLVPITHTE